jgi:hypothetical protein
MLVLTTRMKRRAQPSTAAVIGLRSSPMSLAIAKQLGRPPRRRLWQTREAFFTDAAIFALGAAGAYSVSLVGALPGDELLVLPFLPVLVLAKGKRAFISQYLLFYVLLAGWLLGTLIADVYAGTPLASRLKGTARVVFLGLDFIVLAILINGKPRRHIIFVLSIIAVMMSYVWQFRGQFALQWKFGGASALTMGSLLAASYYYAKRKYWVCIGISLFLAWLDLINGFRSQMGVILVAATMTMPIFGQHSALQRGRPSSRRNSLQIILLLSLAGGVGYLANQAIKIAADRGFFEQDLAQKFQTQSEGKLGVLFGGRPETLVAIQAIRDSPILGHGSFPVDPRYLELKQDIQYEYGYTDSDTPEDIRDPVIPTHSHLTMAWVESGIFGGLLWIYILVLTIRAILQIAFRRPNLSPIYCYLLMNFIWDNLYSPLGSVNRLWAAYLVLLSYDLLKEPVTAVRLGAARKAVPLGLRRTIGSRAAF